MCNITTQQFCCPWARRGIEGTLGADTSVSSQRDWSLFQYNRSQPWTLQSAVEEMNLNLRCLKYCGSEQVQGTPRTVAQHSTLYEKALAYTSVVKLVVQLSTTFSLKWKPRNDLSKPLIDESALTVLYKGEPTQSSGRFTEVSNADFPVSVYCHSRIYPLLLSHRSPCVVTLEMCD